jgi:hypothetical protein
MKARVLVVGVLLVFVAVTVAIGAHHIMEPKPFHYDAATLAYARRVCGEFTLNHLFDRERMSFHEVNDNPARLDSGDVADVHQFDVPALLLDDALDCLHLQSDMALLLNGEDPAGLTAPIKGRLKTLDAVNALLGSVKLHDGTHLAVREIHHPKVEGAIILAETKQRADEGAKTWRESGKPVGGYLVIDKPNGNPSTPLK